MKLYQNKYPISDSAKYVIDYVYDNPSGENYYFQLVRLHDNSILTSSHDENAINIFCWKSGIPFNQVASI